jgi:uncharacterized protein YciI
MPLYLLEYRYADQERRAAARSDHLAYMQRLHEEGKVLKAGPVGDGSGAVVLFSVTDQAEAEALVRDDPYTAAGVSADVRLRPWTVVIPAAE